MSMRRERNHGNHGSNGQVWMFMAATAMATTVATITATALTGSTPEPAPVTCECAIPEVSTSAPAVAPTLVDPFQADGPALAADPVEAPATDQAEAQTRQTGASRAAPPRQTKNEDASAVPSAQVEGSLDKEVIRRVVRAHIVEVRYCYNDGLLEDPDLGGKVVVQFTIGEDGEVRESDVQSTTMEGDVPSCIAEAIAKWRFPKPAKAEPVTVTYPFVLEPG